VRNENLGEYTFPPEDAVTSWLIPIHNLKSPPRRIRYVLVHGLALTPSYLSEFRSHLAAVFSQQALGVILVAQSIPQLFQWIAWIQEETPKVAAIEITLGYPIPAPSIIQQHVQRLDEQWGKPLPNLRNPWMTNELKLSSFHEPPTDPKQRRSRHRSFSSEFEAKLYLRDSEGAPKTPQTSPQQGYSREDRHFPPVRVLLVEDNPVNLLILESFLRARGVTHTSARDGEMAVNMVRANPPGSGTEFHLILMDVQLPKLDGLEATRKIRYLEQQVWKKYQIQQQRPSSPKPMGNLEMVDGFRARTPRARTFSGFRSQSPQLPRPFPSFQSIVVALTAGSTPEDRQKALAAGCNDFISKPLNLKWLESKLIEWGSIQELIQGAQL
jgi:CheY-like chemotaxis protein